MKNKKGFLLFGLLTFISCFFCINKVDAWTYLPDFEYNDAIYNKVNNLNEENIYKLLENNGYNPNDYYYLVMYSDGAFSSNVNNKSFSIIYYLKTTKLSVSVSDNSSTPKFTFSSPGGLIPYISIIHSTNTVNLDVNSNLNKNGFNLILQSNPTYLWYLSNNDVNDYIHVTSPRSFEYSEIINTNLIDSVEFKFNDIPLNETGIVYNFDFASVFSDGSYSEMQFSQPFGREYYTGCDEEIQSCSSSLKNKDYLFYDLDFVSRHYELLDVRVFNESPEHITSSYSIILPLEHDIGKYIDIFFHSDYEFEVIFHYKSDDDSTNSFLETIDITNKYGVVFLPWYDNDIYVDRDTFYLTDFKVVGNVDIQVTDSRDPVDYNILQLYSMNYCNHSYQEQTNIPYNCDNLTGVFKFKIDNLTANQTLRFVNHAYSTSQGTKTLITYDTRYFNYTILDTPYSTGEVIDPVTGEKHNINLNDFYNQFNNHSNSGFKSALNRFLSPIKFIFRNISNLFNNYLNQSLQDYFFFAFSLMLIILILRVIF